MIFYTLITASVIILGLMVNNGYKRPLCGYTRQQALNVVCVSAAFFILFAVSALRLNVGNDYAKYCEFFHLIRVNLESPVYLPTEIGFNGVCVLIYYLCGQREIYPVMFAVFAFFTLFFFIKAIYEQADSFGFTFFLFMTLGYYFQTFSTVRYYLALSMALYSVKYLLKKEWVKFILMILVGTSFHKSMILVLPLYFLAQHTYKRYQLVIAALFCSTFFIFRDMYTKIFLLVYPTYDKTEYLDGGTSLVNILRCVAVLIFSVIMYRSVIKGNRRLSFFYYCNLGAIVIYICCSFLPVISRLAYYLTITHILFVPALIDGIKNEKLRKFLKIGVIVCCVIYFGIFISIKAARDGLRILPYQTFIYHDMVPILSDVTN